MSIQADGGDRTSASAIGVWHPFPGQPQIEVNWFYTATTELGRGNHIFYGQAQDQAGNLEEPYQIAQVIWFPPSTPELSASSLTVSPQVARPGDEVTLTIAVRNSGRQEAQVSMIDTLPAGLTPVTATLGYDVTYDPGAGTITWPARLLWPGQWSRVSFSARVDATEAAVLENQVHRSRLLAQHRGAARPRAPVLPGPRGHGRDGGDRDREPGFYRPAPTSSHHGPAWASSTARRS